MPVFDKFKQDGIDILPMSTLTEQGVIDVKTQVCLHVCMCVFLCVFVLVIIELLNALNRKVWW